MADSNPQVTSGEGEKTEKTCWECGRTFETSMEVCPDDGAQLIETDVEDREDPLIGTVFDDRFRIYRKLGEGGMGAVYSARRLDFETDVALKLLKLDFTSNEEIRKRFMYEARVISNLKHPHAIQVFDFGQTDEGHVYMVMELLEGESLADRLGYRFVSYREVFDIIPPICGVLGEAHTRDVVHRDLKPENIYLLEVDGNEEFPKLLDFGIAKHNRAETMTKSGTLWGTPAYMSPEQARGGSVGAAADIYGIGIMLFELITGNLPFNASTQMGHAVKHLKEPVRAPSTIPGLESIPGELDEFLVQMLAKDPDDRPESMEVVAETLDRIREEYFDDPLLDSIPAKEVDPIRLQRWLDEAPDVSEELPAEGDADPVDALGETTVGGSGPESAEESPVEALAETAGFEVVDDPEEETPAGRELQETAAVQQSGTDGDEEVSAEPSSSDDAETRKASSDDLREVADAQTVALETDTAESDELDVETDSESGNLGFGSRVVAALLAVIALVGLAVITVQTGLVQEADEGSARPEGDLAEPEPEPEPEAEPVETVSRAAASQAVRSAASHASSVRFESVALVEGREPADVDDEIEDEDFDFLHGNPEEQSGDEGSDDQIEEQRLREALENTF